jgi:hypothetical protein
MNGVSETLQIYFTENGLHAQSVNPDKKTPKAENKSTTVLFPLWVRLRIHKCVDWLLQNTIQNC